MKIRNPDENPSAELLIMRGLVNLARAEDAADRGLRFRAHAYLDEGREQIAWAMRKLREMVQE